MERPKSNIISFIAKQLKYETLPTDVLVDICLTAYSTADIVNTRNIVIDAFGENIDYTQPRTTHTTNIRGDLLRIFHYLKLFPCAVGHERQYTEHIEKRALVARLDGMSQIVSGLCNIFKKPEESMPSGNLQPGQCSIAADPGDHEASAQRQDNPLVQPVQMPINNQELNMQEPAKQAVPVNVENQTEMPGFTCQFPIEGIRDEPDRVGAELQALSVNPPTQTLGSEEEVRVNAPLPNQNQEGVRVNPLIRLMVSSEQQNRDDARVSSLRVEWVDPEPVYAPAVEMPIVQQPTDQAPFEQPRVDAPAEKPAASSTIQDDSSVDPVEDDLSSLISDTNTSSSSVTSDEDYQPLIMLKSGPDRPSMTLLEARRQVPRPIAPPARRFQFEGLPEPSQPILIPKPIRPLPDWLADDESPSSDLEPTCTKRRRRMGRPE